MPGYGLDPCPEADLELKWSPRSDKKSSDHDQRVIPNTVICMSVVLPTMFGDQEAQFKWLGNEFQRQAAKFEALNLQWWAAKLLEMGG